jgi:hypothetical protein
LLTIFDGAAAAPPPPGSSGGPLEPNIIAVLSEWRIEHGAGGGGRLGNQEGSPSLEVDTGDCWLGATPMDWGISTST